MARSLEAVNRAARIASTILAVVLSGGVSSASDTPGGHIRMLVLGGGLNTRHLFAHNSGLLCDRLRLAGLATCTSTDDLNALRSQSLRRFDVLLIYAWRGTQYGGSIETEAQKQGLLEFLRGGAGLVVVHIGNGSFDDWPEFGRIVGRVWVTGISTHTDYKEFDVALKAKNHPILAGLDDFRVTDELYQRLVPKSDITILATATEAGVEEPIAWTREYGKGRVFYTALGDSPEAWNNESFLQMLSNATQWATRRPVRRMPPAPERNSLHGR